MDRQHHNSPTPAVSHSSHASARLSYPSTLSVRRRRRRDQSSLPVHGFPLALARVSPAVTHGAPPLEAALCGCGCGGGVVGEGIRKSIHTIENVREVAIGEVESESIRKSIEDMQGWN